MAIRRIDAPPSALAFGEQLVVEVAVELAGLAPHEVKVELVLDRRDERTGRGTRRSYTLAPSGNVAGSSEHAFRVELAPDLCGHLAYRLRVYPANPDFTHPFEMGLMRWA